MCDTLKFYKHRNRCTIHIANINHRTLTTIKLQRRSTVTSVTSINIGSLKHCKKNYTCIYLKQTPQKMSCNSSLRIDIFLYDVLAVSNMVSCLFVFILVHNSQKLCNHRICSMPKYRVKSKVKCCQMHCNVQINCPL